MAASLLFRLLFEPVLMPKKHAELPQPHRIIQMAEPSKPTPKMMEAPKPKIKLPAYVLKVPKGHFVGVSAPSKSLQEARMSSINNAMEQIIRAMGATYNLSYEDRTYGSVVNIKRKIKDDLKILAKWFVKEAEQNIVRSDFVTDEQGHHTFFTLIWFPDEKIEEMRKLNMGPKVMAKVVRTDGNIARIEMAEVNDIAVTIYEYQINAERLYKCADFISYYIWKVPRSKKLSYGGVFKNPVILDTSSKQIEISLPPDIMGLGDYLLGASQSVEISLIGYDEIGREVVKNIALN